MRILVTGGAGFIASHLTDALIGEGHEVVIVDNLSSGRAEFVNPKATFYNMDITDPEIEKVFRDHQPHLVNHHAAQKDVKKSVEQPLFDAQVNILGSLNLLQNCVKYGVERFIFASSGGTVYGEPTTLPVGEDHPERPLSPYGTSKLAVEHYLRFYNKAHGLNYICLRYGNIYGPRQDPFGEAGVVAIFALRLLEGKPTIIYGDGEQVRDFLYVEDVVAANLAALKVPPPTALAVNIASGSGTSINLLLKKMAQASGQEFRPVYQPAREGEIRTIYLDIRNARSALGWSPKLTLEQGIRKALASFTEHRS